MAVRRLVLLLAGWCVITAGAAFAAPGARQADPAAANSSAQTPKVILTGILLFDDPYIIGTGAALRFRVVDDLTRRVFEFSCADRHDVRLSLGTHVVPDRLFDAIMPFPKHAAVAFEATDAAVSQCMRRTCPLCPLSIDVTQYAAQPEPTELQRLNPYGPLAPDPVGAPMPTAATIVASKRVLRTVAEFPLTESSVAQSVKVDDSGIETLGADGSQCVMWFGNLQRMSNEWYAGTNVPYPYATVSWDGGRDRAFSSLRATAKSALSHCSAVHRFAGGGPRRPPGHEEDFFLFTSFGERDRFFYAVGRAMAAWLARYPGVCSTRRLQPAHVYEMRPIAEGGSHLDTPLCAS